jgi:predicted transcriptional regulator of viral defense system
VLRRGITRLAELRAAGVTAATVSRMERDGEVVRLARGLYQLPNARLSPHHTLAEAAKLTPRGIVCLTSALAFHDLTDKIPRKVWMAIGPKDWAPRTPVPPLRVVRMTDALRARDVETHIVEGVPVKVFSAARTVVDCFRYRGTIGIPVAIEALKEALRTRKAKPAEIARLAQRDRVAAVVRPYLEALTIDG